MANHKIEIKIKMKHSLGEPDNRTWNINNVHDARDQIRNQVGIWTKKPCLFIIYHNGKEVYNHNWVETELTDELLEDGKATKVIEDYKRKATNQ